MYSLITAPGPLPFGVFVSLIGVVGRSIGWFLIITFLLLIFPNGHLPSSRWRPLAWIIAGLLVADTFTLLFDPTPFINADISLAKVQNPIGIPGTGALFDSLNTLVNISLFILVVIIILTFANVTTGFLSSLPFYLPPLIISISVGIAIMRYRLYNIDFIINRTLVYGILTALLALIYFGLIFILQTLVGTHRTNLTDSPRSRRLDPFDLRHLPAFAQSHPTSDRSPLLQA